MATESKASKQDAEKPVNDWRKRDSLGIFLRDVAIAAVILGAALFLYHRSVETDKEVRRLGKIAKQEMLKDSPAGYAKAEESLEKMLQLSSDYPFAVASLGELHAVRWLDLGVDSEAAKAREWTKKSGELDARINERFGAVVLGMLGDQKYDEAEKYATEISQQAASSHVVNGLGRAFRAQGKLEEAKLALKKSADTEWRNPRFACDLADVYLEDGDFVNALAFYSKGVEASSEHARSLIGRSRAQIARGQRLKDASDTLAEVLGRPASDLSPKLLAEAKTAVAELQLFEQKPDEAVKAADEAIAAYAAYPWAHFVRGRALASLQKPADAAASFDKAIELDKHVPDFYYVAARSMLAAGDQTKAPTYLDACAKALKADDRLHLAYGDLLMQMKKPVEALDHYQKAIGFNSFNAAAHYSKGVALFDARSEVGAGLDDTRPESIQRLTERMLNDLGVTIDELKQEKVDTKALEKSLKAWNGIKEKGFKWDSLGSEEKDEVLVQVSLDELKLALEVQEYYPDAYRKLGDIRFAQADYADGCQEYAQALIQMKQLQRPRDQITALREDINQRLVKDAKQHDIAKAWMDETAALVR